MEKRLFHLLFQGSPAGAHEANLCRFNRVTQLVRAQQKSVLRSGMAACRVGDTGESKPQLVTPETKGARRASPLTLHTCTTRECANSDCVCSNRPTKPTASGHALP